MFFSAILILTSVILLISPNESNAATFFSSRFYQKKVKIAPTISPIIPTPSPTVAPSKIPIVTDFLLAEVNKYRKSNGLPLVQTDLQTCAFAQLRVSEIAGQFDHSGFRMRIENKSLPYPTYSEITENIAKNSNYKNVVASWASSLGHAENMRKDTPFVCVSQQGEYFAYEGWKP